MSDFIPFIVGLGGTTRSGSTSEVALRYALGAAERAGARTAMLAGPALQLPMYTPDKTERSDAASELVALLPGKQSLRRSAACSHRART